MELKDEFEVEADPAAVWALLVDLRRVVPLVPGAELGEALEPDGFRGRVQVSLGPVRLGFGGTVQFESREDAARRAVLRVRASETRGKGVAQATVTSQVLPGARGTRVELTTDLHLSGAVTQYGGALLGGIAKRITAQFAENLAAALRGEAAASAPALSGLRLAASALGQAACDKLTSRQS